MRNKKEIFDQMHDMHGENKQGDLTDFEFRMLQEAIKIEVLTDIRDYLHDLANNTDKIKEYMRDVSAGAQIYQENNPI